jgi:RNA polymerase sigma-70 factor (ECF subfamily)
MASELTTSFMEETISPEEAGDDALLSFLESAHAAATQAWPGVELSAKDFAACLGRMAPDEGDLLTAMKQLRHGDLFLAAGCAQRDRAALRYFESAVMPRAMAAAARIDHSPQFVEEVCGDLRVRLFVAGERPPEICRYLGRGPLAHWVQVVAMRLAVSRKRKKTHEIAMDLSQVIDSLLEEDPEVAPFADQLRQPFAKVFAEALRALSARERNVLRLYLIDGVSAEVIGTMYRVHRATVARWITRAREKVQFETRRRLEEAVRLDGTSFESVVGLMWDGLDLSLATWLGSDQSGDGEISPST